MNTSGKSDNEFSDNQKKQFLITLAFLAYADKDIDENETKLLFEIAGERGITNNEIQSALENPDEFNIHAPEDVSEKYNQLAELIRMMMADGKIYDEEFQFCAMVAEKFSLNPEIINEIIADILRS